MDRLGGGGLSWWWWIVLVGVRCFHLFFFCVCVWGGGVNWIENGDDFGCFFC